MKYKMSREFIFNKKSQKGFIATVAVVILATGITYFSLITLTSAFSFFDFVHKKELRIQANLNSKACLDQIILMISRDYFLSGKIKLKDFDCTLDISNNFNGNITLVGRAIFGEVKSVFRRDIVIFDNFIQVI
jgi:hypothetical protein